MLEELKEANEYILKKIKEKDFTILQIEQFAKENNVPIITKEVAKYLEFLIESYNVKKVLEIGTAIGYSGGLIAKILDKNGGDLTTIEIDEKRYHIALENFRKMGIEKRVNAILGDANEVLKNLNEIYDFVFIDASKGQYRDFFDNAYRLLKENGVIFIDNIMFRGYLYKEYPKRFKTIVRKLDEFIDHLYDNYNFVLLPFGDGIGLVYKREKC